MTDNYVGSASIPQETDGCQFDFQQSSKWNKILFLPEDLVVQSSQDLLSDQLNPWETKNTVNLHWKKWTRVMERFSTYSWSFGSLLSLSALKIETTKKSI